MREVGHRGNQHLRRPAKVRPLHSSPGRLVTYAYGHSIHLHTVAEYAWHGFNGFSLGKPLDQNQSAWSPDCRIRGSFEDYVRMLGKSDFRYTAKYRTTQRPQEIRLHTATPLIAPFPQEENHV